MADLLNRRHLRDRNTSLVVHKGAAFVPQIATLHAFQRITGRIDVAVTRPSIIASIWDSYKDARASISKTYVASGT